MKPSQSATQPAHAYKTRRFQIYIATNNKVDRTQGHAKFVAGTTNACDDRSMVVANFTLISRLS